MWVCMSTYTVDKSPHYLKHMCPLLWAVSPICSKSLLFAQCPRFSFEMCSSPNFINLNMKLSSALMDSRSCLGIPFCCKQVIRFSVLTCRHFAIWTESKSLQGQILVMQVIILKQMTLHTCYANLEMEPCLSKLYQRLSVAFVLTF